ncbi:MAG TPA: hypothetical protein DCQ06_01800 [Myxococcales bacterium]|mgnify:CR=1 FL=1|nr:hypothetical protein [Myxococcales bacterium]HAN30308.1 hypothetical protein [Myxococcales bacterium]
MAIGATIYRLPIELADLERNQFDSFDLHIARHPSESTRYLVVRILARCLEHRERIELTRGVSDTELPAIVSRDLQGQLQLWLEVGAPSAKRVHKATSRAQEVKVYVHKQVDTVRQELRSVRRASQVEVIWFEESLLLACEHALNRSSTWSITRSDGVLYVEIDGQSCSGAIYSAQADQ